MASGEREIAKVLTYVSQLGASVEFSGYALDFGCGAGRLTEPLARRFRFCHGVDISSTMIEVAKQVCCNEPRCRFILNREASLSIFDPEYFSFIYSSIMLQHMPPGSVKRYIREFVRVLKSGGVLVFQVADSFKAPLGTRLRNRIRLRTRIKELLGIDRPRIMMHS
ncbi:MAG: class I SAM-dependent methyltransferase, partial [Bacteroidota bacterium]